jgi:GAF domain-containing protein
MADKNVDEHPTYRHHYRTLGRKGYRERLSDTLHVHANQLDALLCLATCGVEGDDGFFSLNQDVQRTVLELASRLATEINEMQDRIILGDSMSFGTEETHAVN